MRKRTIQYATARDNLEAKIKEEKSKGHKTAFIYPPLTEYAGKILRIKNELSKLAEQKVD